MSTILVASFPAPPVDEREILRYAGVKEGKKEMLALVDECLKECEALLSYQVVYRFVSVDFQGETVSLDGVAFPSSSLAKALQGCEEGVLFAATVGVGIDRLIAKYGALSPTKALFFQAIGAERIESLCDAFCAKIAQEKGALRRRFSPGYGDLALERQKEMVTLLDSAKKIGVCLTDSLLMTPSKSVTAIVGIGEQKTKAEKCVGCEKSDCAFRREG